MSTRDTEFRGRKILEPYLESRAAKKRYVVTDKGSLSYELQKSAGDALAMDEDGYVYGVEFKIEEENIHGNFFLEDWSNLDFKMKNPGWMVTLKTDYLWYYFIKTDELYILKFDQLWNWAMLEGNMYKYKRAEQRKHKQRNLTSGWCVPISEVKNHVWCEVASPATEMIPDKIYF